MSEEFGKQIRGVSRRETKKALFWFVLGILIQIGAGFALTHQHTGSCLGLVLLFIGFGCVVFALIKLQYVESIQGKERGVIPPSFFNDRKP